MGVWHCSKKQTKEEWNNTPTTPEQASGCETILDIEEKWQNLNIKKKKLDTCHL